MTHKKILTRTTAALLCSAFLLSLPVGLIRAEDEDLNNELSGVQQQMQDQANKKADAETRIGSVSEQLRQIEVELQAAVNELKSIEQQRIATETEIVKNERLLQEAEARLQQRENIFYKRTRDIYINGRLSYLDVIIGAKDFNDFATRLDILKRIIDSDISLIDAIKEERRIIAEKKAQLEADRARILELQKEAEAKQQEIEAKKAERQAVLERAQNDRAVAMQAYAELEEASNNIKNMLQQRENERRARAAAAAQQSGGYSGGDVQGTGQFMWPVSGVITSPFGYRTHPIFGTTIFHSGIDIGVDEGTVVHAADSGVVAYSGWISGYGNAVVIDHGNGLSTLYGHNSGLIVSEGQSVSKGQPIAYAGSTGNSTGPHVHFEVRSNGEPVNPLNYL